MELMEARLANRGDESRIRQSDGSLEEIEIGQSTFRGREAVSAPPSLVQSARLMNNVLVSATERNQPSTDDSSISVLGPTDALDERGFIVVIVAVQHRVALHVVPEIPA